MRKGGKFMKTKVLVAFSLAVFSMTLLSQSAFAVKPTCTVTWCDKNGVCVSGPCVPPQWDTQT